MELRTSIGELKSKFWVFQISKLIIFEVEYYRLGDNKNKNFSTSANVFIKSKLDYGCCGQCQKDVLKGEALKFFNKWDDYHLKDLTENQYVELLQDVELLKEKYNFLEKTEETDKNFSFYQIKTLSMSEPKK